MIIFFSSVADYFLKTKCFKNFDLCMLKGANGEEEIFFWGGGMGNIILFSLKKSK